jgi:leucyl-tRNA synthetase
VAVRRSTHRLIDRVTRDYERWSYNTAVAACMEFVNLVQPYLRGDGHQQVAEEAVDTLLLLLAPMTPHLTAEAWERRHGDHIHLRRWPVADPQLAAEDRVTMIVQVNGKVRDRIEVAPTISEREAEAAALASPAVVEALAGAEPRRVIVKPPKLVNVVA